MSNARLSNVRRLGVYNDAEQHNINGGDLVSIMMLSNTIGGDLVTNGFGTEQWNLKNTF